MSSMYFRAMKLAEDIGHTCHESYVRTASSIGPEDFYFNDKDTEATTTFVFYCLHASQVSPWSGYVWTTCLIPKQPHIPSLLLRNKLEAEKRVLYSSISILWNRAYFEGGRKKNTKITRAFGIEISMLLKCSHEKQVFRVVLS